MSSFPIYKSSTHSFKLIGKLSKLHHYLLIILWIVTAFLMPVLLGFRYSNKLRYIFLIAFLLVFISMAIYTKYIKRNIEIIGDLRITKSCLIKSIGGLVKRYYYDDIETLEVKKHLRSALEPLSSDSSSSYRLKISSRDGDEEIFIVSSQSGTNPPIKLLSSLATLEKLLNGKLRIIR